MSASVQGNLYYGIQGRFCIAFAKLLEVFMLNPGLYEQVINNEIDSKLSEISAARQATSPIDKAEASKVLTQYLTDVVQKGLDNLIDKGGELSDQVRRFWCSQTNR